jgi:short-subunit dehydrogenase
MHLMNREFNFKGCSVIVTGGSSGLGVEFARQLAPQASQILLSARSADGLETVKSELNQKYPVVEVLMCPADLSTIQGRTTLIEMVISSGMVPNILINNAGAGDYGSFSTGSAERIQGQIDLNITSLVMLTHALLPHLKRRPERPSCIVNVSSLAASLPMPDLAVYAATKSFVTSFSEALRIELSGTNVRVSCVCPGPTPTRFGQNAKRPDGTDTDRSGQDFVKVAPEVVVSTALKAARRNRACVHPGWVVSIAAIAFRIMPRALLRFLAAKRFQRSQP